MPKFSFIPKDYTLKIIPQKMETIEVKDNKKLPENKFPSFANLNNPDMNIEYVP